ncbi:MAG: beta-ketoacyl synthase N-terminal-like domain-containing protein [Thermoanaerobaculia bacterium]
MSDVVVTGLGVVGPFGVGREALAEALAAGRTQTVEVAPRGACRAGAADRAARVTADLAKLLPPGAGRRMSPPARFAVSATRLALADAALADGTDLTTTGIVTGTCWGPAFVTEQLLRQIFQQGPESASPALFTESVANAAAAQVALTFGARGPTQTITQRESSDLLALAEGARLLRTGQCERVLVGVVEEWVPILHELLARARAGARPAGARAAAARPFDRDRDGFVQAEGSAVFVLETEAAARERGARVHCRLLASVAGFDSSAPAHDWGTGGARLVATLRRGLDRAELDLASIDAVLSGASGSRAGDRLEAEVLSGLWRGGELPPIATPKAVTGEYGGGFLASAVLALTGTPLVTDRAFETPDPELAVRPHGGALPAPGRALVTSLSAGGTAAWAILAAP